MSAFPDSGLGLPLDDLQALSLEELEQEQMDGQASGARIEAAFEALEAALAFLHPREDAAGTVADLRRRFTAPASFFEAPKHVLEESGLNAREALLFSVIPELTRYLARSRFGSRPTIRNLAAAAAFLQTRYTGVPIEHFYLLCLDASGKLIDCKLLQRGTTDSAPFYLKHVLMEVVRTRAHAVVISHNHPSFSARPSQADIACTVELLGALYPVGTLLLDHVIISNGEYVSLREHGFVRPQLWLLQGPQDPLLANWLEPEKPAAPKRPRRKMKSTN